MCVCYIIILTRLSTFHRQVSVHRFRDIKAGTKSLIKMDVEAYMLLVRSLLEQFTSQEVRLKR